ncbi:hypothetical protein [Halalkalibacter sp. APA_J-10(15)]|uniref:hypothetical protein n=1 Tax=Halalkalibacter sp. APA_J-10(15) TaxID=2933805 RepID=UPI001FF699C5|nr:hypothetical protein [Halalkalibacter sp. APA_J-10(15)]MCK0473449.1 hypothetical protein [Halalkalibacter sp. APA_J-10(15)]
MHSVGYSPSAFHGWQIAAIGINKLDDVTDLIVPLFAEKLQDNQVYFSFREKRHPIVESLDLTSDEKQDFGFPLRKRDMCRSCFHLPVVRREVNQIVHEVAVHIVLRMDICVGYNESLNQLAFCVVRDKLLCFVSINSLSVCMAMCASKSY